MKAAKVYAKLGWSVIPLHDVTSGACSCGKPDCRSAGKHPRLNDWQNQATNDPETVEAWIAKYPTANVGIATGAASCFFALDVDPGNGGIESLAALEAEHGPLPKTVQARTGSGGFHYIYQIPDFTVTNSAGKIAPGIDIRGENGQIVVAPSVSAKGRYSWINPPGATEIAEAPAWLVKILASFSRNVAAAPTAPAQRPVFGAASPQALAAAEADLTRHGPAVEGTGGDEHTFVAASILVCDHALTESEALPIFEEWNQNNSPPWEQSDLLAKLRNGVKHSKGIYGAKRTHGSLEAALATITAWNQQAIREPMTLIRAIRNFRFSDPSELQLVTQALVAASGVNKNALGLPELVEIPAPMPAGALLLNPKYAIVADNALIGIQHQVFQRSGVLCEIVKNQRTEIVELESARLQDLLSRTVTFLRQDDKAGTLEVLVPLTIAQMLAARREHPGFVRVIEAVTAAPIFLADGTVLAKNGYCSFARVYLETSVNVFMPETPTIDDAKAAVEVFRNLLCDFKFLEPADFSTWLASLLSPLSKAATRNAPVPLFCVSASTPGAGKTLLADIASRIVTGGPAEIRPYNPKDPAEWGKRVTSYVRSGAPVNVFDNVNGPFGDETLDRLITSSVWSDRILGVSEAPPLPIVGVFYATGNNIEPQGDTVRRCAFIRLDVTEDNPQERSGFKIPDIAHHVDSNRDTLLSAALTILRAYYCAGSPDMELPTWGSFTAWSNLVRNAVVWAGCADPFLTQRRASLETNEGESDAHDFWLGVIDSTDGSAQAIVTMANQRNAHEVLNLREHATMHSFKKLIARFIDKPRHGKRIRRSRDTQGVVTYSVEIITVT